MFQTLRHKWWFRDALCILTAYVLALQAIAMGMAATTVPQAGESAICYGLGAPAQNQADHQHTAKHNPCPLCTLAAPILPPPAAIGVVAAPLPAQAEHLFHAQAGVAARHATPKLSQGPPHTA